MAMRRRIAAGLVAVSGLAALVALAADTGENEALVMRIIFRDTGRTATEGLTESEVADAFSPLVTSFWSEPGPEPDSGPRRRVGLSLIATTPVDARGIADAGLILMGGPSRQ